MEKTLWSCVIIVTLMIACNQVVKGCAWDVDVIGCEDLYDTHTKQEFTKCLNVCSWKDSCSHVTFTFGEFASSCRLEYGKPDWEKRLHGTLYRLSKNDCKVFMIENRGCLYSSNDNLNGV